MRRVRFNWHLLNSYLAGNILGSLLISLLELGRLDPMAPIRMILTLAVSLPFFLVILVVFNLFFKVIVKHIVSFTIAVPVLATILWLLINNFIYQIARMPDIMSEFYIVFTISCTGAAYFLVTYFTFRSKFQD